MTHVLKGSDLDRRATTAGAEAQAIEKSRKITRVAEALLDLESKS